VGLKSVTERGLLRRTPKKALLISPMEQDVRVKSEISDNSQNGAVNGTYPIVEFTSLLWRANFKANSFGIIFEMTRPFEFQD
jgi:hypothetical protein